METVRNDDPVFVDRSGRRRRVTALAGSAGGLALALILLALVAGFTGAGPASVPGWPDAAADGARAPRPKPSRTAETAPPREAIAEATPTRRTPEPPPTSSAAASPATTPPSAAGPSPSPSISVTPTPRNNGRRPAHAGNPHASKKS